MVREIATMVSVLVLLAASVRAEGEEPPEVPRSALDEEIVVTSARFERELRVTGASISVVDDRDIRDRQVTGVSEAISVVPGAFVARSGPPGAAASLFLRGAASNQVLVLLDGIPLNDPTLGGQFNFYDLTTDNLESIEVLRGSASTLYGSEAIGGVVNLRTRRGRGDPSGRVSAEIGSFRWIRGVLSGQGRVDDVDFSASLSGVRTDNDLDDNRFGAVTGSGLLGWEVAPGFEAVFSGRYIQSEAEDPWAFPFGEQIEEDPNTTRDRRTAAGALSLRHDLSDEFRWTLRGSLTDVRSDLTDEGDAEGDPVELESHSDARVGRILGTLEWQRAEVMNHLDLALLGGVDYQVEHSKNRSESSFGPTPPVDTSVRNTAALLLAEVTWRERLVVSGGVRFDDNSAWGTEWTTTASLLYHLKKSGTRFRANYGQGFRGPKPVELYDPYVGNPDLVPESSLNLDFGVEQTLCDGALAMELTLFRLATDELIAYDPTTFLLTNYDETKTSGVEAAIAWRPMEQLLARTWWTFQDPVDETAPSGEDDQLPGRPKWFGGADVSWREETWSVGVHLDASGEFPAPERITPDGDERKDAGRKFLLGVRGRLHVTKFAAITARIENILDDDWYDDSARPSGNGLAFYLGAEVEF